MENGRTSDRGAAVFELLAPAGTMEIFQAVLAAGADAVYVGGSSFGARAYAGNLSEEELLRAIDLAHIHGKKIYLTVNTLLKNEELEEQLYDFLLPLYMQGLDAVLVQDIGVLAFVRQAFPQLSVHASTQMTITGIGVRLLQELGVSRFVMARELSLAEMKRIHEETGAELEAFVHGALCYSYSGQCLFSSILGGRSGNRGRCAQPCRLPCAVLDGDGRQIRRESCVLSLKDLCGIAELNRLHEAGVYSLKIEGRMKQLPYAAGVVACYRRAIDRYRESLAENGKTEAVSEEELRQLTELGSRGGFTDGYYSRHNGGDMLTPERPGYERHNEALQRQIRERYASQPLRRPAEARLALKSKSPSHYEVRCGDACVSVSGMAAEAARKKPLVRQEVASRMQKTGDTPFAVDVAVDMPEPVFLPNAELNRLRREAMAALQQQLLSPYRRQEAGRPVPVAKEGAPAWSKAREPGSSEPGLKAGRGAPARTKVRTVCTAGRELLSVILAHDFVTSVCLDADGIAAESVRPKDWSSAAEPDTEAFFSALSSDVRRIRDAGKEAWLALPRIFREPARRRYEGMAKELRRLPLDGVLARNYEELLFAREFLSRLSVVTDHNLYTYNDRAVRAFAGLGAAGNTIPLELNRAQIARRDNYSSTMVVYGRYPLMVSAQCVFLNAGSCKGPSTWYLRDRRRAEFPVKNYCADCCNVIYNSLPTMLFAQLGELEGMGVRSFRLDFTVETREQADRVLALYGEFALAGRREYPVEWQSRYTRGHYHRGAE